MEKEEREFTALKKTKDGVRGYKSYEKNNFISDEEVIGLDANILVDLVNSEEFKREIRDRVNFNVLKIYTTEIALAEARFALKKKGYKFDEATMELKQILKEFSIEMIYHQKEFNDMGDDWVQNVQKKMHLKKSSTFFNDCKILSNLIGQKKINVYFTEDKDIFTAAKILNLRVRIKIIPEAKNLSNFKVKEFFLSRKSRSGSKYRKRH